MILILTCILVGIFLSAFFSGSETGFYRVTRVRLVMDAKSGKIFARGLLWLVERPSVLVATVLIGNNLANYLVSLGLLLASQQLLTSLGGSLQTFLPVLATPFLFIYGELLPKYLYYNAPYALSTRGAPLMVLFAALFLPVSAIVIGLESLWLHITGGERGRSKYSLERQELQRVMLEGQQAGLLLPVQREMAQNLFTYGVRQVRQFTLPLRGIPLVKEDASTDEMLEVATRFKQKFVAVIAEDQRELTGCYLVGDLIVLQDGEAPMLPVCKVSAADSSIDVLTRLQSQQSPVAQVVSAEGATIGVVPKDRLMSLLLPD